MSRCTSCEFVALRTTDLAVSEIMCSSKVAKAALGEAGAGAAGSIASILALYPLDTARTILQVRAPPYDKQTTILRLIIEICRNEGWMRLYRGLSSALVGSSLSWALYFAWHEVFKRWLARGRKKISAVEELLAATLAGVLTTLLVNPIWVINTRLKLAYRRRLAGGSGSSSDAKGKGDQREEEKPAKRVNTSLADLIRREGLVGWMSGVVPSIVLLINPGIQLLLYSRLRRVLRRAPRPAEAFVMGAVSKFFAVLLTYPAHTVRLRMQSGLASALPPITLSRVRGPGDLAGVVRDLYIGVENKMLTSMLHSAVMFYVVEMFRRFNRNVGKAPSRH